MKLSKHKPNHIAKDRLIAMAESEPLEESIEQYQQMNHEIAGIVNRYLALTPEEYQLKIIPNRKRLRN